MLHSGTWHSKEYKKVAGLKCDCFFFGLCVQTLHLWARASKQEQSTAYQTLCNCFAGRAQSLSKPKRGCRCSEVSFWSFLSSFNVGWDLSLWARLLSLNDPSSYSCFASWSFLAQRYSFCKTLEESSKIDCCEADGHHC